MNLKNLLGVMDPDQLLTVEILGFTSPYDMTAVECMEDSKLVNYKVVNIFSAARMTDSSFPDSVIGLELEVAE